MYQKTWFTNEDKLMKFINKENIEVVSIIGTNNGSSYQLIYKEKEAEACEWNWEREYLLARELLFSVSHLFSYVNPTQEKIMKQINTFLIDKQHL